MPSKPPALASRPPLSERPIESSMLPLRHALACAIVPATAFLIFWGGQVTSHKAGLSVPDWPTSYGKWWLESELWVGNIFWEHLHRMIAQVVGFMTLCLAIWTAMVEPRFRVRVLAAAMLVAVVVQGILGGITVHFMLPTPISVSHATLAQIFFCLTIAQAVVTSPLFVRGLAAPKASLAPARMLGAVAIVVVLLQLVAGAVMRHTDSGLAVPDFPYAYGDVYEGQFVPRVDDEAVAAYNAWRVSNFHPMNEDLFRVESTQIVLHMIHRLWAIAVTAALLSFAGHLLLRHRADRTFAYGAVALLLLLATQIALGIYTVLTEKLPVVTSFHVATGAVLLGATWFLTLRAWLMRDATETAAAFAADGASDRGSSRRREEALA